MKGDNKRDIAVALLSACSSVQKLLFWSGSKLIFLLKVTDWLWNWLTSITEYIKRDIEPVFCLVESFNISITDANIAFCKPLQMLALLSSKRLIFIKVSYCDVRVYKWFAIRNPQFLVNYPVPCHCFTCIFPKFSKSFPPQLLNFLSLNSVKLNLSRKMLLLLQLNNTFF